MESSSGSSAGGGDRDPEVGFAKLQGEDFEYYMQTYSIVLGRNSKHADVDVDLVNLGGGMNISRRHAQIFYDFSRRRFALEVFGKNGCLVEGVLHVPGTAPIKLDSQDLLQIGDKKFYFLLPSRSALASSFFPRRQIVLPGQAPRLISRGEECVYDRRNRNVEGDTEERLVGEEEEEVDAKRIRRDASCVRRTSAKIAAKSMKRSRANREADNYQLKQLEENDVLSSVAYVLSNTCGTGGWIPMEKLHAEILEHYGSIWHHSRVRRYLTCEDWPQHEATGKPWFGLLMLLRKYPEHFAINTRSKGTMKIDFVSLVSLIDSA